MPCSLSSLLLSTPQHTARIRREAATKSISRDAKKKRKNSQSGTRKPGRVSLLWSSIDVCKRLLRTGEYKKLLQTAHFCLATKWYIHFNIIIVFQIY
jgi:hypothetical protein